MTSAKPLREARNGRDGEKAVLEEKVLDRFIAVYCKERHGSKDGDLCGDCSDLRAYALRRLRLCPYDPKPRCKACPTHCYRPGYREKIQRVMRFSGTYYVKRGRLDWLLRYFMT